MKEAVHLLGRPIGTQDPCGVPLVFTSTLMCSHNFGSVAPKCLPTSHPLPPRPPGESGDGGGGVESEGALSLRGVRPAQVPPGRRRGKEGRGDAFAKEPFSIAGIGVVFAAVTKLVPVSDRKGSSFRLPSSL